MNTLSYVFMALLILGGVLALSGVIASKQPSAKQILDKLVPFQALIGVGLLVVALIVFLQIGPVNILRIFKVSPVVGGATLCAVLAGIALGFFFGMPQLAKLGSSQSHAQYRALELSQKLAPYTALAGVVALGSAAILLLERLGLLKHIL